MQSVRCPDASNVHHDATRRSRGTKLKSDFTVCPDRISGNRTAADCYG